MTTLLFLSELVPLVSPWVHRYKVRAIDAETGVYGLIILAVIGVVTVLARALSKAERGE